MHESQLEPGEHVADDSCASGQEPEFCGSDGIPQVSVLQGPVLSREDGDREAPFRD